jgi:hypothetical protein
MEPRAVLIEIVAEMLRHTGMVEYTTKIDVFALGLLFGYMLSGHHLMKLRGTQQDQYMEYEEVLLRPSEKEGLRDVIKVRSYMGIS